MRISIIIIGLCVLFEVSATSSEADRTSFWDMIPVISQGKSVVQLIFGDTEGAKETQEKFLNEGLITSQLRSAYFLVTGEPKTALNIQEKFVSNLEGVVDSLPIVGHVKGGVHLLVGDKEHGWNALKSSTSTTGAIVGGVFGGPVGAIGGHLLTDGIINGVDAILNGNQSHPHGLIDYALNIKNLKPGDHFDVIASLVLDTRATKELKTKSDKSKSDINQIVRKESDDLIPLLDKEGLKKNKRIVGMPKESDSEVNKEEEYEYQEEETENINDKPGPSGVTQFKKPLNKYSTRLKESVLSKFNVYTNIIQKDRMCKQSNLLYVQHPYLIQNMFTDINKYENNYYLDKLDIDSLKNKLNYLTDTEKSLIKKYDFRTVDSGAHQGYYNGFLSSLAGLLNTNIKTIQTHFPRNTEAYGGTNPIECLETLKMRNILKYATSDRINSVKDLNVYLKSNAKKLKDKKIIIDIMKDDESGSSVVLKHKFDNDNPDPVLLLVDFKYPGIMKPEIPNPFRFRSYITTEDEDYFYICAIEPLK